MTGSDETVTELLDPEGRSFSVRIDETSERLVARPRGFPLWFLYACVLFPAIVAVGYFVNLAMRNGWAAIDGLHALFIVVCFLATTSLMGIIKWLHHQEIEKGEFCILNNSDRTLILPRVDVKLDHRQIIGFVELRAWHIERTQSRLEDTTTWTRLTELTVLAHGETGDIARYPIATCQRSRPVHRLGEQLAGFFGVQYQVIIWNRRVGDYGGACR